MDQKTFDNGKHSLKQNLATSRILKMSIIFDYDRSLKLGLEEDKRKLVAERLEGLKMADIQKFHKERIAGDFSYIVLGDREKVDFEYLKNNGEVNELTLETLFGY